MLHLFTHNDLDGVSCGIVAKCAFGSKVEVRFNSLESLNGQVERYLQRTKKSDSLIITDLGVNEANEAAISDYVSKGGKAKLIDHHKSTLSLNRHAWADVRVAYEDGRQASAASLFYDYLVQHRFLKPSPSLEAYVELVRLYDTWEWESTGNTTAKRLNDLFYLLSIEEFEEKMLDRLRSSAPFTFTEFEEKLLAMEEEKIGRYLRRKRRELIQVFVGEHCAGVVHAESYHSELGNALGKEHPHLDYIAIINLGNKKISFRTIHDHIDVSAIAEAHGGGGHAKAAGCSITDTLYRHFVAEPFRMDPARPDAAHNEFNVQGSEYGTLYENGDARYFVYPASGEWRIDRNWDRLRGGFTSFEEAERFLKRHHGVWLVRDELYIQFLMDYQQARSREEEVNPGLLVRV